MNKYNFSPKSELKAIHELPDPSLNLMVPVFRLGRNGRSSGNTLRRC